MPTAIPNAVKRYLWDVNTSELSTVNHSKFIIERVLEYGDFDAIRWLTSCYSKEVITKVLKESRKISPKTGSLYALYFDVPKEELLCIRKPFTQKQARF